MPDVHLGRRTGGASLNEEGTLQKNAHREQNIQSLHQFGKQTVEPFCYGIP